jgi:hypothetical protein
MTLDEMKKIDKIIRSISDPFGTGYPRLKKLRQDTAVKYGLSEFELLQLFSSWKAGQY